jgi:hypothetical protein
MAEQKTKPTQLSVTAFLNGSGDNAAQQDYLVLVKLMEKITGASAVMWGSSIVGFGSYHYKYESGHEWDICLTGFSPRKANISLYVLAGAPRQDELLKQLGKHKAGKGCLYVKKLADINLEVLELLIKSSVDYLKAKYPS